MQIDPLTLAAIAAPFLAKGAEAFSKSAGDKLGAKVGELCQAVADKFRGDSDAEETLALAQTRPDSKNRQSALEEVLAEKLEGDPDFAARVQRLMDELQKEGDGRAAFGQRDQTVNGPQTNIAGNIQGPVFSSQFNGPVSSGGDAVDMRDSPGALNRPSGPVRQHFGDVYKTYFQQTEKFPVPHQILPPPRNFTGREDLISEILTGFSQGRTAIGLRGVGGLGKTALAYKLAELLRERYRDGQLMVNLQGTSTMPLTPSQAMSQLLRYYYPATPLPESQEGLRSLFLSTLDGKSVLMLLDNALDDQQVMPLLPPSSCGLIITSRRKLALSDIFPFDVEVLKLKEARELLVKTARPRSPSLLPHEKVLWNEIARLCGCLPVALKAAGGFLANTPGSDPKKYIKQLEDERQRLKAIGKFGVDEDVLTKFSLSYRLLTPDTAQVFRMLSVFPAEFYAQAEEAVCLDEGHQHLDELARWSLVEYQRLSEEDEGRYHLHDLVRLFAAERLLAEPGGKAARNEARQRHAEHFRDVLSFATKLYENGDVLAGLNAFDLERMNIESGWAWARENLALSDSAASICNAFLNWPYLFELRQHPREFISWLETALAAARKLKDRSMEGVYLGSLGNAYAALGEPRKAIEHYEQALAIAKEIGDWRNEGVHLGNLGLAYADLG